MNELPTQIKAVGITGGSGFLGSALARRLAGHYEVRILDKERPGFMAGNPSLSYRSCDITSKAECLEAIDGLDAVFHRVGLMGNLASMKRPLEYYSVNLLGTLNVLDACVAHKVKRFIFDSTEAVYGRNLSGPIREEDRPEPNSIYGATKLSCEAAVKMYDDKYGLSTLIFRYSRTRDCEKKDVVSILAEKVQNSETITLYDGGEPIIDFVEREDVIEANVKGLTSSVRREVVNISSGEGVSFSGLLSIIEGFSGRHAAALKFEKLPDHPPISEHKFGSKRFFLCINKARDCLGWTPAHNLESSIRGSIAILKNGKL